MIQAKSEASHKTVEGSEVIDIEENAKAWLLLYHMIITDNGLFKKLGAILRFNALCTESFILKQSFPFINKLYIEIRVGIEHRSNNSLEILAVLLISEFSGFVPDIPLDFESSLRFVREHYVSQWQEEVIHFRILSIHIGGVLKISSCFVDIQFDKEFLESW